jgi:aminopeptidase-like protein
MRGVYGEYREYHTSLDNKALISFAALQGSIDAYEAICRTLDRNLAFRNLLPFGEPQLGRRGLYPTLGTADQSERVAPMMWLLNLSDGRHDLLAIAERSGLAIDRLWQAAKAAEDKGVVTRCPVDQAKIPRGM